MTVEKLACIHALQETIKKPIHCRLLKADCSEQYEGVAWEENEFTLANKQLPEDCVAKNNLESEK